MATTPSNKPPERIKIATAAAALIARARAAVQMALDTLTVEQAAVKARIKVLEGVLVKQTAPAWCADLTEDATGEVATVEIPGEGKLVLIAPTARAPTAADGTLTAREAQTAPQVFFNAAILPGWQKYKPTYRRGTITALDNGADTADVTLSNDLSSAQGLGINVVSELKAVPVQYMGCNAAAFEVGDACVIEFVGQTWEAPRVVGFVSNPRACQTPDVHLVFYCGNAPGGDVPALVRGHSGGGVNLGGLISGDGQYRSVGVVLLTNKVTGGMHLTDVTDQGTLVSYQIPVFYNGTPLLYRQTSLVTSSGAGGYEITNSSYTRALTHGAVTLVSGTYQGNSELFRSENGVVTESSGSDSWNNFIAFSSPASAGLPNQNVIKTFGPWAAWSACLAYVENGNVASSYNGFETITTVDTYENNWQAYSLPASPKIAPVRLANLAQIPARLAVGTVRAYTSASFAGAPLDRHAIDFGYLPYTIDGNKVRSVGKLVAWHWPAGFDMPGSAGAWVNIVATNYKTGASVNISAPEFFAPSPLPADYIPPNVVLADTWAVLAKNDTAGPYFWLWVYALNVTAGTWALQKRMTNKPGPLGVGFEDVVQLNTPGLPADAYLIGAMRDELGAM